MRESEAEAAMPKMIDSSSPNLTSKQPKLCGIFIFGMAYQEVF